MRTPTRRTTQRRSLQNTGTYHRHAPSHEENDALDTVSIASSIGMSFLELFVHIYLAKDVEVNLLS